jgi:hypothetical protein
MHVDPSSSTSSSPASSPSPSPPTTPNVVDAEMVDAFGTRERGRFHRRHFHHRGHHHHGGHGVVPGLVVVAWGVLLWLREVGTISPALRFWDFWPLAVVGVGVSMAVYRPGFGRRLIGLVVLAFGVGLLSDKLGMGFGIAHFWPLLMVAGGVGIVWHGLTHRRIPAPDAATVSADELRRSVTMGGLELTVESQQFKGGALSATMGGVEVDLRRAAISGEQATIDVALLMSGLELCVPSNWQVVSEVAPFMGAVEDKTEPRPDNAGVQKKLFLRGTVTMAAITITN